MWLGRHNWKSEMLTVFAAMLESVRMSKEGVYSLLHDNVNDLYLLESPGTIT